MTRTWPHASGETIRAANDNADKEGLATGDNDYDNNKLSLFRDEAFSNFFSPGVTIWTISSGLVASMSAGAMYYDGNRIPINAVASKTFSNNTTTYVDIGTDGVVDYNSSSTLALGHMRNAIITTSGGAITSIVQSGYDNNSNPIHNTSAVINSSVPVAQKIVTASGSFTPSSTYEMLIITALANDLTINAPSGTPADGQAFVFKIRDDGTSRNLVWNGAYVGIGVTLPTVTGGSKTVYVAARYAANESRWDVLAVARQA